MVVDSERSGLDDVEVDSGALAGGGGFDEGAESADDASLTADDFADVFFVDFELVELFFVFQQVFFAWGSGCCLGLLLGHGVLNQAEAGAAAAAAGAAGAAGAVGSAVSTYVGAGTMPRELSKRATRSVG